jgi:hypothetical protein
MQQTGPRATGHGPRPRTTAHQCATRRAANVRRAGRDSVAWQQLTADRIPIRDASFVWKLKF